MTSGFIKSVLLGRRLARDRRGSMAVEFALITPVLLAMLLGMTEFGVLLYTKLEMTDAARSAARELAIGRSNATVYTAAFNRFYASAPGIPVGSATLTFTVNGSTCNTNTGCQNLLITSIGQPASVSATRSCSLRGIIGISFVDLFPGCLLRSTTTSRIE